MKGRLLALTTALLLLGSVAWAQIPGARVPYCGYLYPAGGRQGTTFQMTVCGQFLNNASAVGITGEGVQATIIDYLPAFRAIKQERLKPLDDMLKERLAVLSGTPLPPKPATAATPAPTAPAAAPGAKPPPPTPTGPPEDPPLLPNLERIDPFILGQLRAMLAAYYNPKSRVQVRPMLGETLIIEVTLDPGATSGDRELRVLTPLGLTNARIFQVSAVPETWEREPNERNAPPTAALDLPAVLNGQILPGDVDAFRIRARKGQHLVLNVDARHLIPYLADAVPGWFQATLALWDSAGNRVAYCDDFRCSPDPALEYTVPQDGEYLVEITDSIFRGREDFVYRITAGEQPFLTGIFPLGGSEFAPTIVDLYGWNLPQNKIMLDTDPGGPPIRYFGLTTPDGATNFLPYAVSDLNEILEKEPNDTPATAQRITLPLLVNGRIGKTGDLDYFRVTGRAGQTLVAEIMARRLDSPLDSLLRLTDAAGKVLVYNDDTPDASAALCTHVADSYLRFRLPADGEYYIQVSDVQRHGGDEYAYRLRLSEPRPDFSVRLGSASLTLPTGKVGLLTAQAYRRDGFDGDILLGIALGPPGTMLSGARIPRGVDRVTLTLTAPPDPTGTPQPLQLEARADVDGMVISHPTESGQEMEQAFAYKHLVPSGVALFSVTGRRALPAYQPFGFPPVRLVPGGSVRVPIALTSQTQLNVADIKLQTGPPGVSVAGFSSEPGGIWLLLKADAQTAVPGTSGNLIPELFSEYAVRRPDGTFDPVKRRYSMGLAPAIPFDIINP